MSRIRSLLLLTLIVLATVVPVSVVGRAAPAAAVVHPTVDITALDMVPDRTWGVSGQNPIDTQTSWLDVLVWDFAQIGDRMFVGGAFLNVQESANATPIPQPYVAAFDLRTGAWISSWRPRLDRAVYALDVSPGGSLLVGGEFTTVNGVERPALVALDPISGAIDPTFAGAAERPWSDLRSVVRDIEVVGDQTYVAGNFSHLSGADGTRAQLAKVGRLIGDRGVVDAGWHPYVTGSGVWGIDVDPAVGEASLAGFFTSVNGLAGSGYFHTVNLIDGAAAPGKLPLPRNYPAAQPEMFDVTYGNGLLFAIGEQHIVQALRIGDHRMIGFNTTGTTADGFAWENGFAGGGYQVGERIGNILFAGCHCTFSERDGRLVHYSSFTGRRTAHRLVMAYDATTGQLIEGFKPDINSPRDGAWAVTSDTNGCLYLGGDFHVGGVDHGFNRWLGGFGRFCPRANPAVPFGGDDPTMVASGSIWRFNQSGGQPAPSWTTTGFNDGNWPRGFADFGFGDNQVTGWKPGVLTYYARNSFSFTGAVPASLELELKADDGAVVYLNGTELVRDNMPDGPVTATTSAAIWREGEVDEGFRSFVVPADALRTGTNVVAVEVHNVWADDHDAGFDLRITASEMAVDGVDGGSLAEHSADWARS